MKIYILVYGSLVSSLINNRQPINIRNLDCRSCLEKKWPTNSESSLSGQKRKFIAFFNFVMHTDVYLEKYFNTLTT